MDATSGTDHGRDAAAGIDRLIGTGSKPAR
jgi:hypothetical protein